LKTYKQIRERFSWKGLKGEVMQHIQECRSSRNLLTIIKTSRFLEDLQADPREVLMEGPQRGSYAAHSGM